MYHGALALRQTAQGFNVSTVPIMRGPMPRSRLLIFVATTALTAAMVAPDPAASQIPLGLRTATGQTVTPAFEGWYENADGTFILSFGYFNRNFEEVVEIPAGPGNLLEPAAFNGAQPTIFHPRRHWGVFTVTVPADFGEQAVVWTIDFRGQRYSIPGSLHTDWQIDALAGEAGSGNTPPVLAFAEGGTEGAGPAGVWSRPVEGVTGIPVFLTVWAKDDGKSSGSVGRVGSSGEPVTLTWFKHTGPGGVTFSETTAKIPAEGGKMATMATFEKPGDYVLRVRANDASGVAGAGHAQCCWTNGFVRVRVTR